MSIARRYRIFKSLTAVFALAWGGTGWAQQAVSASAGSTLSRPLVGLDLSKTMTFSYQDAPLSAVLAGMSEQLGLVIINGPLPPTRMTIQMRREVGAEEAIRILNEILVPAGYVALVSNTTADAATGKGGSTILRVVAISDGIKSQIPVFKGADPDEIPLSDNLRTQIIPIETINAAGLLNDLRPLIGNGVDVTANSGSNTVVITDTAAKIRRIVQIIQLLDGAKKAPTHYEYRQLRNANAAEAALLINTIITAQNAVPGGGVTGGGASGQAFGISGVSTGRGSVARGGGGTSVMPRLYAGSDARTNLVILSGPDDQMLQALDLLNRIDTLTPEELNSAVLFIKPLGYSNAATLTATLNGIFGNGTAANTGTTAAPTLTLNRGGTGGVGNTSGTNRGGTRGGTTGRFGS